jgi:hypothetical protein
MGKVNADTIRNLMESTGSTFSKGLGIDLRSGKPGEIFKWFLAAILFGARISESLAARTYQVFDREGITSPERILKKGWDGLVQLLDEGGYARYDFKTATKLLETAQALEEQYGGNLNRLHGAARDHPDLENRIQSLAKGIGPVTTNIFLREMRGIWEKAEPLPGGLCTAAARSLGLIPMNLKSRERILGELKNLWKENGLPEKDFADFEAALVRWGMENRKKMRAP